MIGWANHAPVSAAWTWGYSRIAWLASSYWVRIESWLPHAGSSIEYIIGIPAPGAVPIGIDPWALVWHTVSIRPVALGSTMHTSWENFVNINEALGEGTAIGVSGVGDCKFWAFFSKRKHFEASGYTSQQPPLSVCFSCSSSYCDSIPLQPIKDERCKLTCFNQQISFMSDVYVGKRSSRQ